jgi:hypothetical protein
VLAAEVNDIKSEPSFRYSPYGVKDGFPLSVMDPTDLEFFPDIVKTRRVLLCTNPN